MEILGRLARRGAGTDAPRVPGADTADPSMPRLEDLDWLPGVHEEEDEQRTGRDPVVPEKPAPAPEPTRSPVPTRVPEPARVSEPVRVREPAPQPRSAPPRPTPPRCRRTATGTGLRGPSWSARARPVRSSHGAGSEGRRQRNRASPSVRRRVRSNCSGACGNLSARHRPNQPEQLRRPGPGPAIGWALDRGEGCAGSLWPGRCWARRSRCGTANGGRRGPPAG